MLFCVCVWLGGVPRAAVQLRSPAGSDPIGLYGRRSYEAAMRHRFCKPQLRVHHTGSDGTMLRRLHGLFCGYSVTVFSGRALYISERGIKESKVKKSLMHVALPVTKSVEPQNGNTSFIQIFLLGLLASQFSHPPGFRMPIIIHAVVWNHFHGL